jgi:hypothetical protein
MGWLNDLFRTDAGRDLDTDEKIAMVNYWVDGERFTKRAKADIVDRNLREQNRQSGESLSGSYEEYQGDPGDMV